MKCIKFFFILFALFIGQLKAQQDSTALIFALNAQIVKVNTFSPEDNFEDMKFFDSILKDKKIIALGEGTHGTREHFLYKDRLIRYLITHHNLKHILIESNVSGLEKVNGYVLGTQKVNVKEVLLFSGIFGIYFTQEVVNMVAWVKHYNTGKKPEEKVRFRGMDMQNFYAVSKHILDIKTFMVNLSDKSKKDLLAFNQALITKKDLITSNAQVKDLQSIASELKAILKSKILPNSLEPYGLYVQLFEQMIALQNRNMYRYSAERDNYMAENVAYIAKHSMPAEKVVVWARNGHISKYLLQKYEAMGMKLRKKYGNQYYALGLLVADGYGRLYEMSDPARRFKPVPLPGIANSNHVEYVFKQAKYENFFFQISEKKFDGQLKRFVSEPRSITSHGPFISADQRQNFQPVILDRAYDGVVFFRNTTAATEVR